LKKAVATGTRPVIFKMAPVIKELGNMGANFFMVHAGQHCPSIWMGYATMSKKVIVTGGAGFIDSHLSEELANREYQVNIIDNPSSHE